VAAYRADIEIGVKGIQQLQAITKQINTLSTGVDGVNKRLAGASQSLNAYNANLAKAAATLNKVNAGTIAEADAVRQYVQALGQANAARDRQNRLIQQQIALQRKVVPTANAGFGVQGPALPPAAGGTARRGQGIGGRLGGAISGSIIGGAFPLLFGQGGGAAAGGAIGGLVGGLAGPGGSFAGSLLGTLLGDIASRGQAVKQLAEDIGFSAQQTKQLSDAFKVANTDVEKFTAVIQNIRGVGLEIEDQAKAIQLVTRLTELYGGSFEKTGNAITSVLESGKVTQANLNQLTSQGINIQQALADKYNVNRDAILKMAKDGEISVQDLVDTLVKLGNSSETVAKKQQNVFQDAYQQIASAANKAANTAINSFTKTGGTLQQVAADIQSAFTAMFSELIRGTSEFILGLGEIARIAGSALDSVAAKFIEIQYGIIGAARNLPVLDSGIIEFAKNALAVLNPVGFLIDKIRGVGKNRPQQFGPEPPPVSRAQIESFRAVSQAMPSGAGSKASDKAARDAERLAEQRQKQLEMAARMAVLTEGELQKSVAVTEQEKLNTEYAQQRMERMVKYETLYKEALSNAEIEYLLMAQSNEILAENYNYQKELLDIALAQSEVVNKADPLASAQQELDLLTAKIQGKEQEYLIQKQINDLIMQGANPADAQGLILTIQDLDKQNKAIEAQKQLWADIYTTVSGEIQGAIRGLIEGTAQWGEVLSNILGSLGNLFLNAAFSGLGGALKLPGFASGGFVTRPTTAVVGEGGEPEYVIPASKMRGAMGRYAAGARGSSVIPTGGDGGETGGTATTAPTAIDVRYSVERINNVDYVTADQFQAGMQQAAAQGAAEGQRQTLRRLQQSPSTRRRIGV
jgi:tape measure domain-containing protein